MVCYYLYQLDLKFPLGSVFGNSHGQLRDDPDRGYFKTYGSRSGIAFVAKAIDQNRLAEAQDEARVLLRAYRHLGPGQDDNFSHLRLRHHREPVGAVDRGHSGDGGRHRLGVHGGGRHRDHEHHAGGGHGANARDRDPQVAGRAAERHPESVPGGIGGAGRRGRTDRRGHRVVRGDHGAQH